MANQPAPVALFAFARPGHLRRTLETLAQNEGARVTQLYIFLDGVPENASPARRKQIKEVRAVAEERPWTQSVEIIRRDRNLGLADSIRGGVGQVVQAHGRVIVLEDDLVTMPGFLRFMNQALDLYADEDAVHQISGFMPPTPRGTPPTGFLRVSTSWGWATWERAWHHFNNDAESLLHAVERKGREAFDLDGHAFYFEELAKNARGELKTWHVRWYASLFLRDGLCLFPRRSLVKNTGFDDSGANCDRLSNQIYRKIPTSPRIDASPVPLRENDIYLRSYQAHFDHLLRLWTGNRLVDRLQNKLKRLRRSLASHDRPE